MLYAVPQGAPLLVVHAHSNGCDIGDMRQTLQSISDSLRVHVMSFEFPGYGLHIGKANMRAIDEAAKVVANFLFNELKLKPAQVVWYGRSIGSGPATRMAHMLTKDKKQPGGLIVQCGFANFKEVAAHLFGRFASRLVSPLWPNEAMMKELKCPVLLIHGRLDKMIPLTQSEKLWQAVSNKVMSKFHVCDCGHDNFPFQRSVLRPIHEFLTVVVSTPGFPADNFTVSPSSESRASVRHLGPLKGLLPFTLSSALQRPQLERWVQRIPTEEGGGTPVSEKHASYRSESSAASAHVSESSRTQDQSSTIQPPPNRKKREGNERKPIPNFCTVPPPTTAVEVLSNTEGLIRTCAVRMSEFLELLLLELEKSVGLEEQLLENVVTCVEAQYWRCDPLLSLWEEVSLDSSSHVAIYLGPFFVENSGKATYRGGIGDRSLANTLRVPLWVYQPPAEYFSYIAEWCLLQSKSLQQSLPSPHQAGRGDTSCCCCFPRHQPRSKRDGSRARELSKHPSREIFASQLAANFAHWVRKTAEIASMFDSFAGLHVSLKAEAPFAENAEGVMQPVKTDRSRETAASIPSLFQHKPSSASGPSGSSPQEIFTLMVPPWSPHSFSEAVRHYLGERLHTKGSRLVAFCANHWHYSDTTNLATAGPIEVEDSLDSPDTPPLPIFRTGPQAREADWTAAIAFLEYERELLRLPATRDAEFPTPVDIGSAVPQEPMARSLAMISKQVALAMKTFGESLEYERRRMRLASKGSGGREPLAIAAAAGGAKSEMGASPAALSLGQIMESNTGGSSQEMPVPQEPAPSSFTRLTM